MEFDYRILLAAGLLTEFGSQATAWLDVWPNKASDVATRMTGVVVSICYLLSLIPQVRTDPVMGVLDVALVALVALACGVLARARFGASWLWWVACLACSGMVGMFSGPSGGAEGLRTLLATQYHLSPAEVETWVFLIRKSIHVAAYGSIAMVIASLMKKVGSGRFGVWPALTWVLSLACFDEFRQSFTPGRTGSWVDVLIDLSGATAALTVLTLISRRGSFTRSG